MGRSKSSCLKIITCAHGDEVDDDEDPVPSPESKVHSDKRTWSFRKKSATHQVPSSTIISEPIYDSYDKEIEDTASVNIHCPKNPSVSEISLLKDAPNEVPPVLSVSGKSELIAPLVPDTNSSVIDHNIKESDGVIIQAFIRGYLVRRELPKLKNVVKLQAAVRGHLVRRQAVGTLRCAQAIIKMQVLIRARRARRQEDEKFQTDMQNADVLGKRKPKCLLSNGFARQLLESTPKTKPIYINCDISKSDSAWMWLERWMTITLTEGPQLEQNFQGIQEQEDNSKPSEYENGNDGTFVDLSASSDSKLAPSESKERSEDEMHLITIEKNDLDMKQEKDTEVEEHMENLASLSSQISIQTDTSTEIVHDSIFDKSYSADSKLDNSHFHEDSSIKPKDIIFDSSFSCDPRVQVAASECGTEISISSTLDSPDRSEAEGGENVLELGSLERQNFDANGGCDISFDPQNTEAKSLNLHKDLIQSANVEEIDRKLPNSTATFDSIEPPTPELHGTSSSQNSVNAKKNKRERKKPDGKLISQVGKKSPSNNAKDSKIEKRWTSLGTARPDHIDQEPRISTTSNSIPSYMQATESARAKALLNISPKSSPDFHNEDNHLKKRHSLPIANGKQGSSPRIQRSTSQAKGTGTQSPHNSAERRWQR